MVNKTNGVVFWSDWVGLMFAWCGMSWVGGES